jgi:hypothetical protein
MVQNHIKSNQIEWTHCCIHRQALACKRIPVELGSTLSGAVKIVNFIKSRATNSRLFRGLCEDFASLHFIQKLDGFLLAKF